MSLTKQKYKSSVGQYEGSPFTNFYKPDRSTVVDRM